MVIEDLCNARKNFGEHTNQPNLSVYYHYQSAAKFIYRENVIEIAQIAENNCVLLKTLVTLFYTENIPSLW